MTVSLRFFGVVFAKVKIPEGSVKCPDCKGSGERRFQYSGGCGGQMSMGDYACCPSCDGRGFVSAPSFAFFNGFYWMTCEYRNDEGRWFTLLYKGKSFADLKVVSTRFIPDSACAFQYLFGSRYVLTYSVPSKAGWKLMVREGFVD